MERSLALAIAEDLVVNDIATPEEIADAIFKAWSDGYATGDEEGYNRGHDAGFYDGLRSSGPVG
jgi:hypothetical protein